MNYSGKFNSFFCFGVLFLLIFLQHNSFSQISLKDRSAELVFTGGGWLNAPSKIWVGDIDDYDTKSVSALLRIMGDVYINPYFTVGLYLNMSPGYTHISITADNSTFMFEYGAAFKPVFYFSEQTSMKVGANIGWRSHKSGYSGVDGHGLGVNCSVEIQHLVNDSGAITFEPGFLAQPVGYADDDTERYAYAPIFYFTIGYTIAAINK